MRLAGFLLYVVVALSGVPTALGQEDLQEKGRRAEEALKAGNYAAAVELYEELIQTLPLSGLKMNLGMAYYQLRRFPDAIGILEPLDVDGSDPALVPVLLYLGSSYFQLGQMERAIRPLRDYVSLMPEDRPARQMLAQAFEAAGKLREAAREWRELSVQDPGDPVALYSLGRMYEGLSGAAFEKLETKAPESEFWFALIGDLRLTQQQYSAAFYFYRKALERNPGIRGVHVAVSHIYRAKGNADWAGVELQKETDLGAPDCQAEPMVCTFLNQDYAGLADLASREETPEALYWRVQAYNQLALEAFSRLSRLPPSATLHRLRAEINRGRGNHKESAEDWKRVVDLLPEDQEASQEWAFSLVLSRDYETARPLVDGMLKADPDSVLLNFLAGDIRLNQQQAQEAVPYLLKSIRLDPEFLASHSSLGRAYVDLGQPDKAVAHLEKALALDSDGSIHYQLARAYQGSGQRERARDMMGKYQEIRRADQAETEKFLEEIQITPPE